MQYIITTLTYSTKSYRKQSNILISWSMHGSKNYTAPYIVFGSDSGKGRSCELTKFCYNAPNTYDFPNNIASELASSPRLIFDLSVVVIIAFANYHILEVGLQCQCSIPFLVKF